MSETPFSDEADGETVESESVPMQSQSMFGRLFDGDAQGPSVGELQSDYNLNRELAVPLRGVMRIADGAGVPPIAEIILGVILVMLSRQSPDAPDLDLTDIEL